MFETWMIGSGLCTFSAGLEVSAVRWWCVRAEPALGGRQAAQAAVRRAGIPQVGPVEAIQPAGRLGVTRARPIAALRI